MVEPKVASSAYALRVLHRAYPLTPSAEFAAEDIGATCSARASAPWFRGAHSYLAESSPATRISATRALLAMRSTKISYTLRNYSLRRIDIMSIPAMRRVAAQILVD